MSGSKRDAALAFACNIAKVRYEDIPADAVEAARRVVFDTLACAIAGSNGPICADLAGLVGGWGGTKESTMLVFGTRVPAASAALVNGTLANILDFDDTHDKAIYHAGCSIVTAALATAEHKGGTSGKEFLTAVTVGIDVACRMALAPRLPPTDNGWAQVWSPFGAAAAASKILGLDEDKIVNAIGFALCQASGSVQTVFENVHAKGIQKGLHAKAGVISALMAETGFAAAKESLEGRFGFFNLYLKGDYDPVVLTAGLGRRYETLGLTFKPYPSCRYTHGPLDATLALVREYDIQPSEVEKVVVRVGAQAFAATCAPVEERRRPSSPIRSQFSIPWSVATAIVKRKVGIDSYSVSAIHDEAILEMAQKVVPAEDESLSGRSITPAIVEISTKRGKEVYTRRIDYPFGSLENPMPWDVSKEKFKDCASHAARPLPREKVERMLDIAPRLEQVKDMREIVNLLV